MAAPSKWTVEWYATAKGEKPLKAFLEGLKDDEENFADAVALLELLEAKGNALRPPRSGSLGGGCSTAWSRKRTGSQRTC